MTFFPIYNNSCSFQLVNFFPIFWMKVFFIASKFESQLQIDI